jgi:hypothetical protein
MSTKTIKIPGVLVVADPARHVLDPKTKEILVAGTREHAPMTPVELEATEADRLLALFGERAEEVAAGGAEAEAKAKAEAKA